MTIWVVYERPADYPDWFVAREWFIPPTGATPSPGRFHLYDTLNGARDELTDRGLVCIPRDAADDPVIVETWL